MLIENCLQNHRPCKIFGNDDGYGGLNVLEVQMGVGEQRNSLRNTSNPQRPGNYTSHERTLEEGMRVSHLRG